MWQSPDPLINRCDRWPWRIYGLDVDGVGKQGGCLGKGGGGGGLNGGGGGGIRVSCKPGWLGGEGIRVSCNKDSVGKKNWLPANSVQAALPVSLGHPSLSESGQ